jgi:uncharacterized protein YbjT (DUF2867 family)
MKILVVVGAGYIGSHMVKRLGQLCCEVTTLENLSSGYRGAVLCGDFVQGDLADTEPLADLLQPRDALCFVQSGGRIGTTTCQVLRQQRNQHSALAGRLSGCQRSESRTVAGWPALGTCTRLIVSVRRTSLRRVGSVADQADAIHRAVDVLMAGV